MNKQNTAAFYANLLLALLGAVGLIISILTMGLQLFSFYTQLSNIFCLCSALLYLFYYKKEDIPQWVKKLRYFGTCTVTVTFLVVVFILAPMFTDILEGYRHMFFDGANFFYHVSCPILAFISFVFLEKEITISWTDTFRALIPTVLYAFVAILLNVLHVLDGPYPFLRVYNQSILASVFWCVAILLVAWVIALVVRGLHNRFCR